MLRVEWVFFAGLKPEKYAAIPEIGNGVLSFFQGLRVSKRKIGFCDDEKVFKTL
jgi:hypothetical protein